MRRLATVLTSVIGFALGIQFYCRGFLLSRQTLSAKSACSDIQADYLLSGTRACWITPAVYARAVIIVVDALRFDFATPQRASAGPPNVFYHNKLAEVHRLLTMAPSHARLMQFTADPPTTTMQRLKGLTTGSLPTFIDAGANFDGSARVDEDNLLDQLAAVNRSAVVLGDDTWTALFPRQFLRTHTFPSFDVKDLHTVDNGVLEHLYDELERDDWTLLVAHFLGVDHCGHKYGPAHPEMAKKLNQMNQVIRNVTQVLDGRNDTILFVIGDHGMTETGDHGGDSANELNAAMFVYSPHKAFAPLQAVSDTVSLDHEDSSAVGGQREAAQVDLVPTLALLLDVPVPFASLGAVLPELFADAALRSRALRVNAWQVVRYADSYADAAGDAALRARLAPLVRIFNSLRPEEITDRRCVELVKHIQAIFRDTWAKFHDGWMLLGLLTLFETLLWTLRRVLHDVERVELDRRFGVKLLTTMLGFVVLAASNESGPPALGMFIGLQACWDFQSLANWLLRRLYDAEHNAGAAKVGVACMPYLWLVPILVQCVSTFSNSFIIYENLVSRFICSTLLVLLAVVVKDQLSTDKKRIGVKVKLLTWRTLLERRFNLTTFCCCAVSILILRISCFLYGRCREEQLDCQQFGLTLPFRTLYASQGFQIFRFSLAAGSLVVSTVALRRFLQKNGHLEGTKAVTTFVYIGPWTVTACVLFHWAALWLPETMVAKYSFSLELAPPVTVYFLTLSFTALLLFDPYLVHFATNDANGQLRPGPVSGDVLENRSLLFRHFKANLAAYMPAAQATSDGGRVSAFGLATVYSGALAALLSFWLPTLGMVLGDGLIGGWTAFVLVVLLVVSVGAIQHAAGSGEEHTWLTTTTLATLTALTYVGFFTTGHQPTFTALPWDAAFVGLPGNFRFQAAQAALVVAHLFATGALVGIVTPLLAVTHCRRRNTATTSSEYDALVDANATEMHAYRLTMQMIVMLALKLVSVVLASCIHRRHLMVWKIFAPKFIFEAASFFVVCVFLVIGNLLMKRIHRCVPAVLRITSSVS